MPNVDELLQGARDAISVKRVFGEPIETEGVTIVPAVVIFRTRWLSVSAM